MPSVTCLSLICAPPPGNGLMTIDVHPDGTRFATGGLDNKVSVPSVRPRAGVVPGVVLGGARSVILW